MFKKILCTYLMLLSSIAYSKECDFITYDWLIECARKSSYTDHIPTFRRLFNTVKVRGFIECGCGYSTKYFMDNCDKVVSIEFMNPGTSDEWYQECKKLYKNCNKWVPLLYNADHKDKAFNQACAYACSEHKDYALIDPSYLTRLNEFFKKQIYLAKKEGKDIDVAFVDPGVYIRGDMVKLFLQNKIPIVMAHDTACDYGSNVSEGHYAWFVVKTPPDYEKIFIPFGQGTTFWINKSLPNVIKSIKDYRDMVLKGLSTYDELTKMADHF